MIYAWKAKYGGLEVSETQELKQLRDESARLKRLVADLSLDKEMLLCWIYDNNHITIEGKTRITFTEDVAAKFLLYGWNALRVGDANDLEHRARVVNVPGNERQAYLHRSRQPHRLWLAAQAGYLGGAW